MALKITKSEEPINVERINVCLYGQPGIGKTTASYTAEAPLLLDFDKGSYRAANRRDTVLVDKWADISDMSAADLEPYKTIIVDTAGRCLDCLTVAIIKDNPKAGRDGALTLQGYGTLKSRFSAWLKLLNSFGKDVILVAHCDEQKQGDDIIERLDVQGGSKGEIYKSVDAMGRIFSRANGRVLDFSPREGSFGKNPGQFDPLTIPNVAENPRFMAETIAAIKGRLNSMSAAQAEAHKLIEDWAAAIAEFANVEDFNGALEQIKKAPQAAKALFNKAAQDHGLKFDKIAKVYRGEAVTA